MIMSDQCISLDLTAPDLDLRIRSALDGCHKDDERALMLNIRHPDWVLCERYSRPYLAAQRLHELASPRPQKTDEQRFKALAADLRAPAGTRIPAIIKLREACRGRYDGNMIRGLCELGLWKRTVVLSHDRQQDTLCYRFIGSEISQHCGRRWASASISRPHNYPGQHDMDYSDWVSGHYLSAFQTQQPRRDLIDATIESIQPGEPANRVNYDRVLMPMNLIDGRPAVVSVSEIRPGLLPLFAADVLNH